MIIRAKEQGYQYCSSGNCQQNCAANFRCYQNCKGNCRQQCTTGERCYQSCSIDGNCRQMCNSSECYQRCTIGQNCNATCQATGLCEQVCFFQVSSQRDNISGEGRLANRAFNIPWGPIGNRLHRVNMFSVGTRHYHP